MGLQFEGVYENICEPQLAFIRDVLERRGYKDTTVTFEAVSKAGDNYVANVKRIIVQDENGEFRMIAKLSPQNERLRAAMETENLFRNEHIMYLTILPKFQELEEEADIPKENRLRFAKCYGSFETAPYEVILLEDLIVPGFSMENKFKSLSDKHVKSVLKNFALLHSLSYVLKQKRPETFKEFSNSLFDMWGSMGKKPETTISFEYLNKAATMLVEGDNRKEFVKGSFLRAVSLCSKYAKQDAQSRYTIIQQGDSWTNNILFKINEEMLIESVLIDYQISKGTNPTCDLLYMIFNCTDHKSRMEHFSDWIDFYHSELGKALFSHGLNVNYVYPREQLDADMKRYAKIIFGVSVIVASSVVLKPEEATKITELMEKPENFIDDTTHFCDDTSQQLKRRLEGIVDSFIKFGLF